MFNSSPFLGQVVLRPRNLGCGGGFIPAPFPEEDEESDVMMGCDEHRGHVNVGCAKCKKKKRPDWTLEAEPPAEMVGTWRTERHGIMAGRALGQGAVCAAKPPVLTPDTNCQRTEAGDIICSNNVIYSGTCPYAPAVNYPGVAPSIPGSNIPKAPPYKGAEEAGGAAPIPGETAGVGPASSTLPVVGIVAGGALVAGLAYLLFSK